jgi:hypothetical protein
VREAVVNWDLKPNDCQWLPFKAFLISPHVYYDKIFYTEMTAIKNCAFFCIKQSQFELENRKYLYRFKLGTSLIQRFNSAL